MNTLLGPYLPIGRILASTRPRPCDTSRMRMFRLRNRWIALLFLAFVPLLPAQTPPPVPPAAQVKLPPEELSQLLSPIALYPDALIALILPASTVPSDVVMGARYVAANGDLAQVDGQPWDDSVKSLTRYPDVLSWMDQNLDWTASVGEAFMDQPADVMNAIQALRAQAKAAGSLIDTPEQKVVVEDEYIRIVPADPEIIYVPQYDPQVVYVESYTPSIISFGVGFAVGSWLNYDFDWRRRCVYRGNWRGWDNNHWNNNNNWRGRGGDTVNVVNIDVNNANVWRPGANSVRQLNQRQRNNNGNARFANARVEQPRNNNANAAAVNGRFDPNRTTAMPRPSRLNVSNNRPNRPDRPNRPGTAAITPTEANPATPDVAAQTPRNPENRPNQQRPQTPSDTPAPQAASTPPARTEESPGRGRNREIGQAVPEGGSTPRPADPPRNRPRVDMPSIPPQVAGQINPPAGSGTPANRNPRIREGTSNNPPRRDIPTAPQTTAPQVTGQQTPPTGGGRNSQGENRQTRNREDAPPQPRQVPQAPRTQPPQVQRPSAPQQRENPTRQVQRPQQAPQQAPRVQQPQQAPRQQAPRVQQPQQAPRQQAPQVQRQEQQVPRSRPQAQPQQAPQPRPERPQRQAPEMRQPPAQASAPAQPQQGRGGGGGGNREGKGNR